MEKIFSIEDFSTDIEGHCDSSMIQYEVHFKGGNYYIVYSRMSVINILNLKLPTLHLYPRIIGMYIAFINHIIITITYTNKYLSTPLHHKTTHTIISV